MLRWMKSLPMPVYGPNWMPLFCPVVAVMFTDGPVVLGSDGGRVVSRRATWKRNSLRLLPPSVEITCTDDEIIASAKSLPRSIAVLPPPLWYGLSLVNVFVRHDRRCAAFIWKSSLPM